MTDILENIEAQPVPANQPPQDHLVIPYNAAGQNVAVARCCMAYERARKTAIERRRNRDHAMELAIKAYKEALPALFGRENVRDFIACVAQGSLMQVFGDSECKRLLYAAQIAHTSTDRPVVRPQK